MPSLPRYPLWVYEGCMERAVTYDPARRWALDWRGLHAAAAQMAAGCVHYFSTLLRVSACGPNKFKLWRSGVLH